MRLLERDQERERREFKALKHSAVLLDERRRMIVELTIREVAEHRTWIVHALGVRSNHVHVVVTAEITPENVMNSFKSWATRRMVEAGALPKRTKTWSRHGSTRYLWTPAALEAACRHIPHHCKNHPPLPDGRGTRATAQGTEHPAAMRLKIPIVFEILEQ